MIQPGASGWAGAFTWTARLAAAGDPAWALGQGCLLFQGIVTFSHEELGLPASWQQLGAPAHPSRGDGLPAQASESTAPRPAPARQGGSPPPGPRGMGTHRREQGRHGARRHPPEEPQPGPGPPPRSTPPGGPSPLRAPCPAQPTGAQTPPAPAARGPHAGRSCPPPDPVQGPTCWYSASCGRKSAAVSSQRRLRCGRRCSRLTHQGGE